MAVVVALGSFAAWSAVAGGRKRWVEPYARVEPAEAVARRLLSSSSSSSRREAVVVTGASSGLGLETVRAIVAASASAPDSPNAIRVVAVARNVAKARAALEAAGVREGAVDVLKCDQADLADVRRFTIELESLLDRDNRKIKALVLNAGLSATGRTSRDGWEEAFATNHLSHFLMFRRLAQRLVRDAPTRVVILSSGAHAASPPLDWPNPSVGRKGFNSDADSLPKEPGILQGFRSYSRPFEVYAHSKLCNVLMARGIAKRAAAGELPGVEAVAVHPGVVSTNVWPWFLPRFVLDFAMLDVPRGASTQVFAALAPATDVPNGSYFVPGPVLTQPEFRHNPNSEADAERLWSESERIVQPFLV